MDRRKFLKFSLPTLLVGSGGNLLSSSRRNIDYVVPGLFEDSNEKKRHFIFKFDLLKDDFSFIEAEASVHSMLALPSIKSHLVVSKKSGVLGRFPDRRIKDVKWKDYSKYGFAFYGHAALDKKSERIILSVISSERRTYGFEHYLGVVVLNAKTMELVNVHRFKRGSQKTSRSIHDLERIPHTNKFVVCTSSCLTIFDVDTGVFFPLLSSEIDSGRTNFSHALTLPSGKILVSETKGYKTGMKRLEGRRATGYSTIYDPKTNEIYRIPYDRVESGGGTSYFNLVFDRKEERGVFSTVESHQSHIIDFSENGSPKVVKDVTLPGMSGGVISPDGRGYIFHSEDGLVLMDKESLKSTPISKSASAKFRNFISEFPKDQRRYLHPLLI